MVKVRVQGDARFNVLLTEDRPRPTEYWTHQLPRLLEPQGVASYIAHSGRQAIRLAEELVIHAAVIDMATPLGESEAWSTGYAPNGHAAPAAELPAPGTAAAPPDEPAGLWLLELLRRLPNRPPIVIVHNADYSQRQLDRLLRDALRLGAFSVLNKPVELEQLLRVFQRVLEKQYRGLWPSPPGRRDHGPRGGPGPPDDP